MNDKEKPTILLCKILSVLICIVFLFLIGVASARFISFGTGAQTIGIAGYAVTLGAVNPGSLEINCNTDTKFTEYDFWVKNEKNDKISDVSIQYKVKVQVPGGLPAGLSMTIDGVEGMTSSDRTEFVFTDSRFQTPAGVAATNNHTLSIIADEDVITSNLSIPKISVTIEAVQKD